MIREILGAASRLERLSRVEDGIEQVHDRFGKVCLSLYHGSAFYLSYRYIVER